MTSSTQTILDDILDWCFKNAKISESVGEDKNGDQVNLIHYAAQKGYTQVVKKLVDGGIDVNYSAPNCFRGTPLHYASENGKLEVAQLLLEKGANINCQDIRKMTPLHIASNKGHLEVAKLFLEKGANINSQGYMKETPLHIASNKGHLEVGKLLLEKEK